MPADKLGTGKERCFSLMKIGIFDSGIGGLSVLPTAARALPNAEFLYYADVKNVPYGEKTPEEILRFSLEAVNFLISEGATAIVVACNTATSVAVSKLRAIYEREDAEAPAIIIGMEPAVKRAIDLGRSGRIIMAATPVTVRGEKLSLLLERYDKDSLTDSIPLPMLVRFAEREEFDSEAVTNYLRESLSCFELERYCALVLGCTHFNYFKDSFRTIIPPNVALVDGVDGTVRRLVSRLGEPSAVVSSADLRPRVRFFESGEEVSSDQGIARFWRFISRLEMMERID